MKKWKERGKEKSVSKMRILLTDLILWLSGIR